MSARETGVGITRLGQVAINAKDVERAAAFYQEKLGLTLLFKAPPGLAFFDCGGVRLMLSRAEKAEFDHPSSVLYFADLWLTSFRDTEGNLMALMSEVAR